MSEEFESFTPPIEHEENKIEELPPNAWGMPERPEDVISPQENIEVKNEVFSLNKWITMAPGMEIDQFGKTEQWQPVTDEECKMTYASNNGVMAFVDGAGRESVAPYTSDRIQALKDAGYKEGSFWVPLSNSEEPTNPELRNQWLKMREEGWEQNRKEAMERHLELYRAEAEKKGIKEVTGEWFVADGVEAEHITNGKMTFDKNTDGYSMGVGRLESVGCYASNNGVMAFVDGAGRESVAPYTSDRIQALKDAGYKEGSFWVPLSNSEEPTNPELRNQWLKMREEGWEQNRQWLKMREEGWEQNR